jgi:hypothetical protein
MLDDQVIASRHCDDWHRAERVYRRMKSDAQVTHVDVLTREAIEVSFAI